LTYSNLVSEHLFSNCLLSPLVLQNFLGKTYCEVSELKFFANTYFQTKFSRDTKNDLQRLEATLKAPICFVNVMPSRTLPIIATASGFTFIVKSERNTVNSNLKDFLSENFELSASISRFFESYLFQSGITDRISELIDARAKRDPKIFVRFEKDSDIFTAENYDENLSLESYQSELTSLFGELNSIESQLKRGQTVSPYSAICSKFFSEVYSSESNRLRELTFLACIHRNLRDISVTSPLTNVYVENSRSLKLLSTVSSIQVRDSWSNLSFPINCYFISELKGEIPLPYLNIRETTKLIVNIAKRLVDFKQYNICEALCQFLLSDLNIENSETNVILLTTLGKCYANLGAGSKASDYFMKSFHVIQSFKSIEKIAEVLSELKLISDATVSYNFTMHLMTYLKFAMDYLRSFDLKSESLRFAFLLLSISRKSSAITPDEGFVLSHIVTCCAELGRYSDGFEVLLRYDENFTHLKLFDMLVRIAIHSNSPSSFNGHNWSIQHRSFLSHILVGIARTKELSESQRVSAYLTLAQLFLSYEDFRKAAEIFVECAFNSEEITAKLSYLIVALNLLEKCQNHDWVYIFVKQTNEKILLDKSMIEAYYYHASFMKKHPKHSSGIMELQSQCDKDSSSTYKDDRLTLLTALGLDAKFTTENSLPHHALAHLSFSSQSQQLRTQQ
jgi:hypothetical protein